MPPFGRGCEDERKSGIKPWRHFRRYGQPQLPAVRAVYGGFATPLRCMCSGVCFRAFATHALSSGVDAKTLAGILGHTKASFTLDTYTHTTGDMQKRAAEIVGGFLTDYLGEEMNPWQSRENMAAAPSV